MVSPINTLHSEGAPGVFVMSHVGLLDQQVYAYESFKWIQRLRGVSSWEERDPSNPKGKYVTFERKEAHQYRPQSSSRFRAMDLAILDAWAEGRLRWSGGASSVPVPVPVPLRKNISPLNIKMTAPNSMSMSANAFGGSRKNKSRRHKREGGSRKVKSRRNRSEGGKRKLRKSKGGDRKSRKSRKSKKSKGGDRKSRKSRKSRRNH